MSSVQVANTIKKAQRRLWRHLWYRSITKDLGYLSAILCLMGLINLFVSWFVAPVFLYSVPAFLFCVPAILILFACYQAVKTYPSLEQAAVVLDQFAQLADVFVTASDLIQQKRPLTIAGVSVINSAERAARKIGLNLHFFLASRRPAWPLFPTSIIALVLLAAIYPHTQSAPFFTGGSGTIGNTDLRVNKKTDTELGNNKQQVTQSVAGEMEPQSIQQNRQLNGQETVHLNTLQALPAPAESSQLNVSKLEHQSQPLSLNETAQSADEATSDWVPQPAAKIMMDGDLPIAETKPVTVPDTIANVNQKEGLSAEVNSSPSKAASSASATTGHEAGGLVHQAGNTVTSFEAFIRRGSESPELSVQQEAVPGEAEDRSTPMSALEREQSEGLARTPYRSRFDLSLKHYIKQYMEEMGKDS